jgi:putative Holliday junction resolvase
MTSEALLISSLRSFCTEHAVSLVVVGLPLSADGSEGPGCVRARRIAQALGATGLRVELQDERWSSREAEEILRETGKRRKTSREKVDAIAASLILSEHLREVSRP